MCAEFRFKKYDPPHDVVLYARGILSEVMDLLKKDAFILATMSSDEDLYTCRLEAYQDGAEFFSEVDSQSPTEALDSVCEEIREKIMEWRTQSIFKHAEDSEAKMPHPRVQLHRRLTVMRGNL